MMNSPLQKAGRWGDLKPRLYSALIMAAIALVGIWAGGVIFTLLVAFVCGGMIWELSLMLAPGRSEQALKLGAISALALVAAALIAAMLPMIVALPLIVAPVVYGYRDMPKQAELRYGLFGLWVMFAAFGVLWLRNGLGAEWLLWLVIVVIATDVAGYFAGKMIGGPKFWPRISPKKTWSGTSAGWVAAAIVGLCFADHFHMGFGLVVASVLVSMASQAGDVAESALKRQTGVKDSSAMIPGHGGLLDRFDGMMGAAAMFLLLIVFLG